MLPEARAQRGRPGLAVLVVEGSPVLRDRLVWLVAEVPGVGTSAGVARPALALERIAAGPVDAILLDAEDAGWPDCADLGRLRGAAPGALIAVLAADPGPELAERCAAAGADHVLSWSDGLGRVDALLRALAAGGAPLAAGA